MTNCSFLNDSYFNRHVWDFIGTVVGEINQLSESVKGLAEKTAELLKMSPSKRYLLDVYV